MRPSTLGACAQLDVGGFNFLGDEGRAAIKEAVRGKEGFELKI